MGLVQGAGANAVGVAGAPTPRTRSRHGAVAMLQPPAEFADYLISLGASGRLVSQPSRDVHRARFGLTAREAPALTPLYRHLAADVQPSDFALALRRFASQKTPRFGGLF